MRYLVIVLLFPICLMVVTGCARQQQANVKPVAVEVKQDIPANLPISKVKKGMSQVQVKSIMGEPNDMIFTGSGKQYIPFYMGTDVLRTVNFYKNQGKITFGGISQCVIAINYDPNEDGWK